MDTNGSQQLTIEATAVVAPNAPKKNAKRTNDSHTFALTKELVAPRASKCTKNNGVVQKMHKTLLY